ncbi:hypothetical protein, partial [Rheinheimera soli]|uniref:hypothetical protein n=1 Tax=Rheinheimera soli TaxID=443616 RepID=UPI001E4F0CE0
RKDDMTLGLVRKLENFIGNISKRVERGEEYETYKPIIEMICRAYNPGWLIVARWHMEQRTKSGYDLAKEELRRFLENETDALLASEAWRLLGHSCYQTHDTLGEVHAFTERAQLANIPFYDLSNTANKFNNFLSEGGLEIDREQKRDLATRILQIMDQRIEEAGGDDLSRMAWLAIRAERDIDARRYVEEGRNKYPENYHLVRLAQRLGISS